MGILKIGIAGLSHETHTFLPDKTGLEPFDRDAVRGPDIIHRNVPRGVYPVTVKK
jgi:microcystin degradation protein MlrC